MSNFNRIEFLFAVLDRLYRMSLNTNDDYSGMKQLTFYIVLDFI